MASFPAMVERGNDGTWTACIVGGLTVLGQGSTKDDALADLREGIAGVIEYLKETGQSVPAPSVELVNVEVAA
jgi:predicted RNase H-like HicB family nuclease